jgi:hypothetical protein
VEDIVVAVYIANGLRDTEVECPVGECGRLGEVAEVAEVVEEPEKVLVEGGRRESASCVPVLWSVPCSI